MLKLTRQLFDVLGMAVTRGPLTGIWGSWENASGAEIRHFSNAGRTAPEPAAHGPQLVAATGDDGLVRPRRVLGALRLSRAADGLKIASNASEPLREQNKRT
jgi:hypothetical protein